MRTYKSLILGGSVMLLAAFLTIIVSPNGIFADTVCDSSNCYVTDTTINDLSQGKFTLTGLSNNGDGAVQLVPLGLTAEWVTDTYRLPTVSRSELAAVIYKDIIYVIGGQDPGGNRISEVITASTLVTGPLKGPWLPTTTPLNPARSGMAAVISTTADGGYLYVLGGSYKNSSTVITNAVSYIHFNTDGQFNSSWQTAPTNAMPNRLVYHQAVVHNGYLYVLGGCISTSACNTVSSSIYRAQINPAGQLDWNYGDFSASLPPPLSPSPLDLFGAVIWQSDSGTDYLYIVGGVTDDRETSATSQVWYTSFVSESVAALGPFTSTGVLPEILGAHSTVQGNGQIFAAGGHKGTLSEVVNDVNSALIDVTSGGLHPLLGTSYWVPSKVLPEPRMRHASVINSGGIVYVIGGASDTAGGSNTVYRGETKGFGNLYAGKGTFTSQVLDLKAQRNITEMTVNSTITGSVTMTVQYRYANMLPDLNSKQFTTTFRGLYTGIDQPTTESVSFSASLIQYQVRMTGTNTPYTSTWSPVFNSFRVRYPPPPPAASDFEITGLAAPPKLDSPVSRPITYWVSNKSSLSAPVRRQNVTVNPGATTKLTNGRRVPPPPLALGLNPRGINAPQADPPPPPTYMFWVSFYADPSPAPTTPNSLNNRMTCTDTNPSHVGIPDGPYPPFIYYSLELYKTPSPFYAQCLVPPDTKKFYAQIDTCDLTPNADQYCSSYGYVQEADEKTNPPSYRDNIIGPVDAGQGGGGPGSGGYFLPFIRR